ncbi:hypothetical protein MRB53_040497 [Persea americana]|nr:hypothetical protein MRB53_040497 [Persea americana]
MPASCSLSIIVAVCRDAQRQGRGNAFQSHRACVTPDGSHRRIATVMKGCKPTLTVSVPWEISVAERARPFVDVGTSRSPHPLLDPSCPSAAYRFVKDCWFAVVQLIMWKYDEPVDNLVFWSCENNFLRFFSQDKSTVAEGVAKKKPHSSCPFQHVLLSRPTIRLGRKRYGKRSRTMTRNLARCRPKLFPSAKEIAGVSGRIDLSQQTRRDETVKLGVRLA